MMNVKMTQTNANMEISRSENKIYLRLELSWCFWDISDWIKISLENKKNVNDLGRCWWRKGFSWWIRFSCFLVRSDSNPARNTHHRGETEETTTLGSSSAIFFSFSLSLSPFPLLLWSPFLRAIRLMMVNERSWHGDVCNVRARKSLWTGESLEYRAQESK